MLMLLVAVTTWAQTSYETSTAENAKWYTIGSYNRGGYLTNVGLDKGVEHVTIVDGSLWYFETADENGGVYFVNAVKDNGENVYLGSDLNASKTKAVWYILPNGVNESGLSISKTNPISNSSCVDANNHNTGVGTWAPNSSDWHGTTWCFYEFGADIQVALDAFKAWEGKSAVMGEYAYSDEAYNALNDAYNTFKSNATISNYQACKDLIDALPRTMPENGKIYFIEAPLFYNVKGVHKALYAGDAPGWKTLNSADKSFYWQLEVAGSKFAFKNLSTETYLNGTAMSENKVEGGLKNLGQERFNIIISGVTVHANGHDSGNGESGNIVSWGGDANSASAWVFTETVDPDLGMAKGNLQNRINKLQACIDWSGNNPGEYNATETAKLVDPIAAAKAVIDGGSNVAKDYEDALTALNNAVAGVNLDVNPVVAGTYRIVSASSSFSETKAFSVYGKDTYYNAHRTPAWAPANENDPLQYWTLEANGEGFNIKAAYEGNYITTATSMSATAKAATFTALGNAQFNITLEGDKSPIHANGWNWGSAAAPLTTWDGGADSPSAWRLVAVNEVPEFTYDLEVSEAGWATLMLGFDATIPADVKAYTVSSIENGYVTLNDVTGTLPAKTAVIIEAAKGKYTFEVATETTVAVVDNALDGTLYPKNITPEGEAYVLGNVGGVVGLYKATLNQGTNNAFLNNANKAYLVVPTAQAEGVASYSFRFGEGTTGISEVKGENGNVKAIYDLTGRKVETISAPGIYIVNGVKKLVR